MPPLAHDCTEESAILGMVVIDLYWWPTENGKKVATLLEETGLEYRIVPINIRNGDQLDPDFLRLSPNGRMPAIVDHDPRGGAGPLAVFESGAILMYLADKVGRFWPQNPDRKWEVVQWVLWQSANQGPKLGEQGYFRRNSSIENDLSYSIRRFDAEVHRIFGVLNLGLHQKHFLAADEYTIADIACYSWAATWPNRDIDIDEFPNVKRWLADLAARSAVQRGMALRTELLDLNKVVAPDEQSRRTALLSYQRAQSVPTSWGGRGVGLRDAAFINLAA